MVWLRCGCGYGLAVVVVWVCCGCGYGLAVVVVWLCCGCGYGLVIMQGELAVLWLWLLSGYNAG